MVGKKLKKSCGTDIDCKNVPLKHKLLHAFWKLAPAFTRWSESQVVEKGISPQRMRIAELLFDNGPTKMCDLRDELGVTATNITALVDALEADGMVHREPHPTDRRVTLIKLTAKAHEKISFGCTEYKDKVSSLFTGFSAAEQAEFFRLLMKMKGALEEVDVLECPKEKSEKSETKTTERNTHA